jgi:hypothetical protein
MHGSLLQIRFEEAYRVAPVDTSCELCPDLLIVVAVGRLALMIDLGRRSVLRKSETGPVKELRDWSADTAVRWEGWVWTMVGSAMLHDQPVSSDRFAASECGAGCEDGAVHFVRAAGYVLG